MLAFDSTAVTLRYGLLVVGLMIAVRSRLGWRLEEILRIGGCTAAAIILSHVIGNIVLPAPPTEGPVSPWLAPLQLTLWFAGIALGSAIGIEFVAKPPTFDLARWSVICAAFIGGTYVGVYAQSAFITAFESVLWAGTTARNPRTLLYGLVLVLTATAWLASAKEVPPGAWSRMAGSLCPSCWRCSRHPISVATQMLVTQKPNTSMQRLIQERQALDAALFFAVATAVGVWRFNRRA